MAIKGVSGNFIKTSISVDYIKFEKKKGKSPLIPLLTSPLYDVGRNQYTKPSMNKKVKFILNQPRNPKNIGAAARGMANFGFREMVVVNPYEVAWRETRSAVNASPVVEKAKKFNSLQVALRGSHLVIGTCAGTRRNFETRWIGLEELRALVHKNLKTKKSVALVFGSEQSGLSTEDLTFCHYVLRIPTVRDCPSMNLSQAVAVVACAIRTGQDIPAGPSVLTERIPAEQLDRLVGRALIAYTDAGLLKGWDPLRAEARIRKSFYRWNLTDVDMAMLHGLFSWVFKRTRKLGGLLFLASFAGTIFAAEPEKQDLRPEIALASIETRIFPELELKNPTGPSDEEGRLQIDSIQTKFLLPWRPEAQQFKLSFSINYESLALDYRNWDKTLSPVPPDQYHAAGLSIHGRKKINEIWASSFFISPSLNSDFGPIKWRDLRVPGGFLFDRSLQKGTLSMGFVLINNYGSPRVFPALGYMGTVGTNQVVVIRIPTLLSWGVKVNDRIETGLAARVAGNNFRIEKEGFYQGNSLRYSSTLAGPYLKWKVRRWAVIGLESGYSFRHKLEVWDGKHRVRNLNLKPEPYISVGFKLLLP